MDPVAQADGSAGTEGGPSGAQAPPSVAAVMAEIDQEVAARRAAGDLPARVERELEELFLEFSPVGAAHGGETSEALRSVDAHAFIDPVVPVSSEKSGGAVIKRGVRSLSLWYMGYVTAQVNQFASAVSRCLHEVEDRLGALEREVGALRPEPPPVLEVPGAHRADAWWVSSVAAELAEAPGRVLHLASGDGWLVEELGRRGVDAYGVDPRSEVVEEPGSSDIDLRCEELDEHLRAVSAAGLGAVVLTGVVEPLTVGEIGQLLDMVERTVSPGGVVVVHSLSPSWWASDEAPPQADLVPGHPLRPATWEHLFSERGYQVVRPDAEGPDFVVIARRPLEADPA